MECVWITGAGGLIGHQLAAQAPAHFPRARIRALTRSDFDLLDFSAVARAFAEDHPSLVIHCAAISRSPDCQADPRRAHAANVDVTHHLAQLAAENSFVFFSTDLVFDGRQGNYVETDPVHALSVYAETKVAAETLVAGHPRHTIIRTSLNYGKSPSGRRAFNEEMAAAWREGRTLRFFEDEFRSPLAAGVTARAVLELAAQGKTGIYHVAGCERLSRWDLGRLVADRHPELQPRLEKTSLRDYSGAPRSPDTSLNTSKAQQFLSFPLPRFTDWLNRHRD